MKSRILNQKFIALLSLLLLTTVFFLWPSHSFAAMEPVWQVLKNYQDTSSLGSKVYGIWNIFIKLTNGFVVVVLIAVAFAQILRLNINTYGVKKILPTLVLAIIAANFSFLFCRLLIDFSSILVSYFLQGSGGTNATKVVGALTNISKTVSTLSYGPCTSSNIADAGKSCYTYGTLFWQGIANLMILAGAIVMLILAYLFIIRNWLIYFFVALAPLAFMSLVLPQTKSLFTQWWTNFSKWVFMPVLSVFWIWVGSLWFSNIGAQGTLMSFIFSGVCFYLAITTPFKMGGTIMSAWGNIGKKITAPIGSFAKDQAGLWWSGQGARGKWYNPLGHIARGQEALKDMKKFNQEKIADNQQKSRAKMMDTYLHRGREEQRLQFGGDEEQAKKRIAKRFQESEKGKKWLEGREEWLNEGMVLDEQIKGNYSDARQKYYNSNKGAAVLAELTRAKQSALANEDKITIVEKDLLSRFFQGVGQFDNDKDKQLLTDRVLFLTRNLASDEIVKKSQQDKVDKVFQDQAHLSNMGLDSEEIAVLIKEYKVKGDRLKELDQKSLSSNITSTETAERNSLMSEEAEAGRKLGVQGFAAAALKSSQNKGKLDSEMEAFYNKRVSQNDAEHLKFMYNQNQPVGDRFVGFAGIAAQSNDKLKITDADRTIGKTMMTRVGKLTSIEVKGDIEKIIGQFTIGEIAEQLDPSRPNKEISKEAIINFKEGKLNLNEPKDNRYIEGRLLALTSKAKDTNSMEGQRAVLALSSMLSNPAAIEAGRKYNESIDRVAKPLQGDPDPKKQTQYKKFMNEKITIGAVPDPGSVRDQLQLKMATTGQGRKFAYSAVVDQPTLGTAKNVSEYLSSADPIIGYSRTNQRHNANDGDLSVMTQKIIGAVSQNTAIDYSKLQKTIGQVGMQKVAENSDAMKQMINTHSVNMAKSMAGAFGVQLKPELRKAFIEGISKLPKGSTNTQIATLLSALQPGSQATPPKEVKISIQQPDGTTQAITADQAVIRAKNIQSTENAIKIADRHQDVQDHMPFLSHFKNLSQSQAEDQRRILHEAFTKLKDDNTPHEELMKSIGEALRKTGFAPGDKMLSDETQQLSTFHSAYIASAAASESYKDGGKSLDMDSAANNVIKKLDESMRYKKEQPPAPKQ